MTTAAVFKLKPASQARKKKTSARNKLRNGEKTGSMSVLEIDLGTIGRSAAEAERESQREREGEDRSRSWYRKSKVGVCGCGWCADCLGGFGRGFLQAWT